MWEKEKGTLMERYTVEQSKPPSQGGAVVSTLTINSVMESDFHSPYNCTAWNSFGPGTMIITLEETGRQKNNEAVQSCTLLLTQSVIVFYTIALIEQISIEQILIDK